jgi:glycosyltransferase involved in cell wall biosynthesis
VFTSDKNSWLVVPEPRKQTVKDQLTLARAFVQALALQPTLRERLRLVMIGEGPLRAQCQAILGEAGVAHLAWLPGERLDIDVILQGLQCFVLPSLAEGISNTALEAMASGLPVIATAVGGNADLVSPGLTGELVAPGDAQALARSIVRLAGDPSLVARMGHAARMEAQSRFGIDAMVSAYERLYQSLLLKHAAGST